MIVITHLRPARAARVDVYWAGRGVKQMAFFRARLSIAVTFIALAIGVGAGAVPARAALPQQSGSVDLLSQANVEIDGAAAGDHAGVSVAGAGDVNGDGIGDVIIGARAAGNNSRAFSGSAYVVFGQPSPTPVDLDKLGSRGFRIDGAAAGDGAGVAVAGAGDVNGDGRADVIVGAEDAGNNSRVFSGSAYVVFGKASTTTVDLSSLGAQGFRIDGAASGDEAGEAVAGAGDVNGDGRADVIVGAFAAGNNSRADSGSAYVVFGKASTATVDLSSLGAQGFRVDGAAAHDEAGVAVAAAGDVNRDGLGDVIIGARGAANNHRSNSGSAYVVFGKASTTAVDLNSRGAQGFRIDGAAPGADAGISVAGAGDVNGDGMADVIVGADSAGNNARAASGSAYVVFGKTSTAPVDLGALGADGFRIDGAAGGDEAGISVAGAGDVNGDGRPDVIVGALFAGNNGRAISGSAYVVFGKSSTTTVDLGALASQGFRVDGAAASDLAGGSVAGAGDVNGDGRADVLVGAEVADDNGRADSGSVYELYGFGTPSVSYPSPIAATVDHPIAPLPARVRRTGPASFAVSPRLPAGLSLDPTTGLVSGTPTQAEAPTVHTITMTDLAGTASAALQVTVSTARGGIPRATKPRISALQETNRVFAVGTIPTTLTGRTGAARTKRGTVFSFRLDQAATLTIAMRAEGRCRPGRSATHGKRRCTRTITLATLTRSGDAGPNRVAFSGRLGRTPLKAGRYEAVFTATNSAGSSSAQVLRFVVVTPRRRHSGRATVRRGLADLPAAARGPVSDADGQCQNWRADRLVRGLGALAPSGGAIRSLACRLLAGAGTTIGARHPVGIRRGHPQRALVDRSRAVQPAHEGER
jgi:Putative Ig domain/FG-GAP repeat